MKFFVNSNLKIEFLQANCLKTTVDQKNLPGSHLKDNFLVPVPVSLCGVYSVLVYSVVLRGNWRDDKYFPRALKDNSPHRSFYSLNLFKIKQSLTFFFIVREKIYRIKNENLQNIGFVDWLYIRNNRKGKFIIKISCNEIYGLRILVTSEYINNFV